jgi:hypothetical protein
MDETVKCKYCDAILRNTPRSIGSHVGYHHKDIAKEIYSKPVEFTMRCLECNELLANSNNVLARHVRKFHSIEWIDYEVKHFLGGVWPKCGCGCGQDLTWRKGGFPEYIDGHATRGQNNPMFGRKGADNPNTGKKRTDAMRRKYAKAASDRWSNPDDPRRETMASDEYRENMRQISKETSKRPEVMEKKSHWANMWWKNNPEMRAVWSERAIDLLEQSKIGPQAPYKSEWKFNPFTDKEEYMHSSWETRFLDECVERVVPVTKQHGIRIPYTDPNGLDRTYIPDFLSLDGKVLYEIKGYETEIDKKKRQAMIQWCIDNDVACETISFKRPAST